MKRTALATVLICSLWFLPVCGSDPEGDGQGIPLCVMSYNVLFTFPNPDYDSWQVRREHVAAIILEHDPDLIGFQEPFPSQINDLHEFCPGYEDSMVRLFPDSSIFYRGERFEKLSEGYYWLSPTPDRLSIGFGNFFPRNAVWAVLQERDSGRAFFFTNTHFDNTSPFQENAAPLFLARTLEYAAGLPIVATGDFNSKPDSEAYRILVEGDDSDDGEEVFRLQDTYDLAGEHILYAWGEDPPPFDPTGRIDHVFVSQGLFEISSWTVDLYTYDDGMRPSDHDAIVTHLEFF